MPATVPVIDLMPWYEGGTQDRAGVARQVDEALRSSGFLLITGHRVPAGARARTRATAREVFALPAEVKARYAITVGGRGWIPPGAEANGYAEGTATPPDLKESFSLAADQPTGDAGIDARWFRPNVWPAEVPRLRPVVTDYISRMHALSDELMSLCAVALGLPAGFFAPFLDHPTYGVNLNWYPPADPARPGPRNLDSTGSARTPISAPSPCSTGSQAAAACRSTRWTGRGLMLRTIPPR